MFDLKFIFAILSTIILVIGFIPYFRDVFLKKSKPHLFTWLIWLMTQGTATAASLYGGGKWGAAGFIIGTVLVAGMFLLSFKYGTKI